MRRPTGAGQIAGGWVMMAIGGIIFLLSLDVDIHGAGSIDPDAMVRRWTMLIMAGTAFGLAILLFAVGWILRAIWFLPARESDPDGAVEVNKPAAPVNRSTTVLLVGAIIVVMFLIAWARNTTP